MAKIKQIRVQSANDQDNLFSNIYVVQLGIQAPPGTQFTLNNSDTITMGPYGLYELDLTDTQSVLDDLRIIKLEKDIATIDILYYDRTGGES